jgi:hypothetical protein
VLTDAPKLNSESAWDTWWLTPVILASWEAEIGRIQGQSG